MVGQLMSDTQEAISTETALRLLTDQQRRHILRQVAETSGGTTVEQLSQYLQDDVARHAAAHSSGHSPAIELHHIHLPMLAQARAIEYDAGQRIVYQGRTFQALLSLLAVIDSHRADSGSDLS